MSVGTLERRQATELRTTDRKLEGYAAIFNSEARIGTFVETILPGAFRSALAGDVLALLDHDASKVLGRTRSGTLRLWEDTRGLAFSLDLPDTAPGRDALALAMRSDLGGMSFGFNVPKGGQSWAGDKRTLSAIGLKEISVISAWPAYPDTSLALRSRQGADDGRRRRLIMAELGAWA